METLRRPYTADEHAQLVAAQARQAGKELDARRIAQEIALRQWCVEQAVAVVGTDQPPLMVPSGSVNEEVLAKTKASGDFVVYDPKIGKPETAVVVVARDILDFVQRAIVDAEFGGK